MGGVNTDIDLDFADRNAALKLLSYVPAAMLQRGARARHRSGVYFQDIPVDPADGLAAYDYDEASARGFFKIDFLPNYIYNGVRNEAHLLELLHRAPDWSLLQDAEIVAGLAHVREHFLVLKTIQPASIIDLAVCIALIRPGKRHLLNRPRHEIDMEIWKPTDEYYFKKPHAVAYAASIVVQMNLLVEQAHAGGQS